MMYSVVKPYPMLLDENGYGTVSIDFKSPDEDDTAPEGKHARYNVSMFLCILLTAFSSVHNTKEHHVYPTQIMWYPHLLHALRAVLPNNWRAFPATYQGLRLRWRHVSQVHNAHNI